ncbi:hypothetical protein FQR65_LT06541 [Abscondita terminalis]|nr:hypothetical protein FQR65_LT06541 [Abscondita terminalis]
MPRSIVKRKVSKASKARKRGLRTKIVHAMENSSDYVPEDAHVEYFKKQPHSDTWITCDIGKGSEEHNENYNFVFSLQRADRILGQNNGLHSISKNIESEDAANCRSSEVCSALLTFIELKLQYQNNTIGDMDRFMCKPKQNFPVFNFKRSSKANRKQIPQSDIVITIRIEILVVLKTISGNTNSFQYQKNIGR